MVSFGCLNGLVGDAADSCYALTNLQHCALPSGAVCANFAHTDSGDNSPSLKTLRICFVTTDLSRPNSRHICSCVSQTVSPSVFTDSSESPCPPYTTVVKLPKPVLPITPPSFRTRRSAQRIRSAHNPPSRTARFSRRFCAQSESYIVTKVLRREHYSKNKDCWASSAIQSCNKLFMRSPPYGSASSMDFVIIRGMWNGPLKRLPFAGCATVPSRCR